MIRIAAAAGVIALLIGAPPRISAADPFVTLFNRTMATRSTIHSIRARFTETTTSTLLTTPLVAHGTIVAAPPARVLMTYSAPERRYVSIDAKSLTVVWPERAQRERLDIADTQKRIDKYFTNASIDDLRSMFTITAAPDPAIANTDRVEMRSTHKQIREGLEQLILWIDRDNQLLVQMEMRFPEGDRKTIRLEDTAVNVPVTDADFAIPR